MSIVYGVIAYFLIATPLAALIAQALQANRRRYPAFNKRSGWRHTNTN